MTTPVKKSFDEAYSEIYEDLRQQLGMSKPRRFSLASILARAIAPQISLLYLFIDALARAILPDAAAGTILERWCAIYGIFRKPATKSEGEVVFKGAAGSRIPIGSKLQDEVGLEFETIEAIALDSDGSIVKARSIDPGSNHNIEDGVSFSLINPILGVNSTAESKGFSGGTDTEKDTELRSRLLFRLRNPPQGGAAHDYISWSQEIPGVTRSWVFKNYRGPGTVGVTFVLDAEADIIPDPESKPFKDMKEYLVERSPITADVYLFAPKAKIIEPEIRLTPNTESVQNEVKEELLDLFYRSAEVGGAYRADGTILLSKIREAISTAEGEQDHTLISPTGNITVDTGEIAILGEIKWLTSR